MKEEIVFAVKTAVTEGPTATCAVFLLTNESLDGKVVSQWRENARIGAWRVVKGGRETVLERVEGDQEVQHQDAFYGQVEEKAEPERRTQIGSVLVFEGKNWKMASEKKWREKVIDIAGFEDVGETKIRGKDHRVLKGPDCFAAVRVTESAPAE